MSRDNEAQIKRGSRSRSDSLAEDERLLPLAGRNPGGDAAPPFDPQTHPLSDIEASDGQDETSLLGLQQDSFPTILNASRILGHGVHMVSSCTVQITKNTDIIKLKKKKKKRSNQILNKHKTT